MSLSLRFIMRQMSLTWMALPVGKFGDRERRDKPAHCRGCKSPTEKEKRLHSGLESCLGVREDAQLKRRQRYWRAGH
jgi:hypothetical protein